MLVVVTAKDLLARDNVQKIRDLVTDLQLVEGERDILSMFSARVPPDKGQTIPPALFPEPLPPGGPEYDTVIQKVRANELISGKLISPDGTLALIVLALQPAVASSAKSSRVIADIRKTMADDLAGSDLKGELAGVPVMQHEIHNSVESDRVTYNAIGFIAGCLIAILFFKRVSFMLVAAAPPLVAILISIGALGWLDFQLNIFLNVMTPLIMVISFSDSMQLTFAIRDRLVAGQTKPQAIRGALAVVGPACVLTHTTTMVSFVALLFSDSDLIKTFGEAGLLTTAIALVTVLVLLPLLAYVLIRGEGKLALKTARADTAINLLREFCRWIAERMVGRPGLYSLIGIAVCVVLSAIYANLTPRYRLADQVPNNEQATTANGTLDRKRTGANPIDVLIQFPPGQDLYSPDTLATIEAVQRTTSSEPGIGNVFSLQTLRDWLSQKLGLNDLATLEKIRRLPAEVVDRPLRRRGPQIRARLRSRSGQGRQPAVAHRRQPRRASRGCAQGPSRLPDRRHRARGDRGAQFGGDDRAAVARADGRDRLCRRLHRSRLSLVEGHAALDPARHFPDRGLGIAAVVHGRGTAVRQRGGADRLVRARALGDDPLPQPAQAGGAPRRQRRRCRWSAPPSSSARR